MGLRGGRQLIRQPLIAHLGMDDTTVGEGVFGYEMAHDMVIGVGINAVPNKHLRLRRNGEL